MSKHDDYLRTSEIELSTHFLTDPEDVYQAWIDRQEELAGEAEIEPLPGGAHTAWEGYIEGENVVLESGRRIVQKWREKEQARQADESVVEVTFEPTDEGTRVTVRHANVPEEKREHYERNWKEHYLEPMRKLFGRDKRDD